MSTQLQLRRGTTAQHSTFTGASGEITIDTDKKTVVVHDGTTAGGMPVLPKTITDGTANGVLYLNSSKQVTSGSGLVFDSSGNLGIGVTPSAWITGYRAIQMPGGSIESHAGYIGMWGNCYLNSSAQYTYVSDGNASRYIQNSGYHFWFTAPSGTAGNAISFTQAMTLDASGNLALGRASATAYGTTTFSIDSAAGASFFDMHNAGARKGYLWAGASSFNISTVASTPLVFETDGYERMRIDSSGNLMVGTTSAHGKLTVNGNAYNTTGVWGTISDQKLKENIVDATPKLDSLCKVKVRNYNLIGDELKQIGVIAQELEEIFPSMVDETPDYEELIKTREVEVPAVLDEDGNEVEPATTKTEEYSERVATGTTTKSVKYSVFVPMLIKAVQEQQAIIESLTQRIEALEYTKQGE